MRDPNRIHEICKTLEKAWSKYPDQRMGQFLENYIFPSIRLPNGGRTAWTFFQEDDETLEKLETFIIGDCKI